MTRRSHSNPDAKPRDPADAWEDAVVKQCAAAMGGWLKGSLHLSRPISSLTKVEVETLARIAIHLWIVEATNRVNEKINPVEMRKLKTLLS